MHELEFFTWIVDAVGSVFMSCHVPTLAKYHYYIKKNAPVVNNPRVTSTPFKKPRKPLPRHSLEKSKKIKISCTWTTFFEQLLNKSV